ncbi:uncharacterized protein LOC123529120 isoform X2 [Mercenaria mercenaria]|nr:uncharacterized protein LOC123529120 isoform X2 [Mercenaria mercenaria]
MSRQMGMVVSKCQEKPENMEDNASKVLVGQLREQITLNGELQEELNKLRKKVEDQNEMIEKQFGKDIERTAKGRYNNTGEIIQPTTLSIQCREIFDEEWRNVMKSLFRGNKELAGIKFLSKILEDCQSFCQTKAKNQLMNFVNPYSENAVHTVEEVIKSTEDLHYLHKLRRTVGLHQQNKAAIKRLFGRECKEREDFQKVTEEIKEDEDEMKCLEEYVNNCCDLCWQCAISDPPVLLKFDVLSKHIDDVSDNFQEYHYKGAVEDGGFSKTVMQVVWPAVVMYDDEGSEILVDNAKGYVIVHVSSAV